MSNIFMAVCKETGEIISGAKGQACFFDRNRLGRSIGQTGVKKHEYSVVEFDHSMLLPKEPEEPKEFKVTEIHGSNWNDEARYELVTPVGGFSIGSLSECPEDATLGRDLNFAYDVVDLMKSAYNAGVRGDKFIVEREDEGEDE
ncbi:hypothetical protein CN613_25435 [Bacillus pseudomycoides]|uniref:Uncharacterized protein n=1 Tax=Bacillus pseudomycoides TaxID=64104 RepID=A0A2A8BYE3_9BACI|nr:hypothetical protein [Bacillus pseudomycoides]PEM65291.1 hypothetical protein CN613_25435 [Bacillus pseudomycoides]